MAEIRPLRGLRPRDDLAHRVIAPPYDVPSEAEARAFSDADPCCFLHITRPEVDLPEGGDPHAPLAYARAAENFRRFRAEGWLVQDASPCLYLYTQIWGSHTQTALLALCTVDAYDRGEIKRHELTRPDKEQDRVDHILALNAQTGLVFLTYKDEDPELAARMRAAAQAPVAWRVQTEDGVIHQLQVLADPGEQAGLADALGRRPALYVADGHHRSAAASRVSAMRGGRGEAAWFLAGIFPDSQLQVLAYNRLVRDLAGQSPEAFLAAVADVYAITPHSASTPPRRGEVAMYLGGTWYGLIPRPGVVPDDPVGSLDVSVLQDRVLSPILGIGNPRTDPRLTFVGGVYGARALSAAVDRGEAALAFHLYPTGLDQLFAVADAGLLMPPKSTWFEPKLRGGVLVHAL